jgi:class 3 adenylate cyclase/predicted ATPase
VLFCDLVGSTELATRVDPEVLRDVVRSYQQASGGVISRCGGYVAQYLGDGLLVYFGFPVAHEDDAQRAVRAGLGIIAAMESLNARLQGAPSVRLAVRVGIHTGLVVVGEMGVGERREELALGEAPNVAARLQAMADPDTVLISAATHRLAHFAFACVDLGARAVKGLPAPLPVYRVQGSIATSSPLETSADGAFTPFVGREQEVALLFSRWEQAKDGFGQVVLLSGEAGIGKSRLVRVLKERVAREAHTRWECRCSAYHEDSALFPIVDLFERALEFGREDSPEERLRRIEAALARYGLAQPDAVALWASFLSVPLPEDRPPLNLTPPRQKQKTFEAIVALLLAVSTERPVVFIVEDLHWVDASTLELLALVLAQVPSAPILMLLTCRPDFRPPWGARTQFTHLTVNRFTHQQTTLMVERVTGGKTLPAEVLQQVVTKTDGVPLFVEELTKMVLESGLVREGDDRYELGGALPPLAIPSTLQDSLMARLDRLATVKEVAQLGAALGRAFPYGLLRAVASSDDATLQRSLARLVEAELLYQRGVPPDATYIFKHALIQETAYQSMLMSKRQLLHQRIAEILSLQFRETAEAQPELVAHHYTEAGLSAEAVEYWRRAGQRAIQRSANVEAIAHLTRGLEVVQRLVDGPARWQRELEVQVALGPALMATKGFGAPEVAHAYARARELCQRLGDTPQLFAVLRGLWEFYELRADAQTGRELAEQLLRLAERSRDRTLLVVAHDVMQDTCLWLGEYATTRSHMEQGLALYDPEQHRALAFLHGGYDPAMACRCFGGHALWYLGYPDQALEQHREALALARELAHPPSLVFALSHAAVLHQFRGEARLAQERAEAAIALSNEHGLEFWRAHASIPCGWALAAQGRVDDGAALILEGLEGYRATGAELERSLWVALLVDAYRKSGRLEEGLAALDEALADVARTGIRFHEPELHRLKGEVLLGLGTSSPEQATVCLQRAIDIARNRQAKSLELRATMSMSRLWARQGKREDGRRALAQIHAWFAEGVDTTDLREARALLEELSLP